MAKAHIPTCKLNNGGEIPALGFGTWLGMNEKNEFLPEDCPKLMDALSYAIDIGYRHIDTAHFYRVEPEVGQLINRKIKEGAVKREQLFVTTKVWQHLHREADVEVSLRGSLQRMDLDYVDMVLVHWPMSITADVEVSLRGSLQRMDLDYVDMVLVHWPMSITQEGVDEKIDYLETWRGFEACLAKGLTKGIGVSNFNVEQLTRLLNNCKVPPAINQIEVNLNMGQNELVSFCQANKIVVVAYSPFGTMVPSRTAPSSPEPKLNNPTMLAIADKYKKTVSQIALNYLFQRGIVSIPKSVTKSRVLENASIFDFTLEARDVETLATFECAYRFVRPIFWQDYNNYPFEKVPEKIEIPLGLRKWKDGCNCN